MKPLQLPDLLPIENPGLCTVQESGNDDGLVCLDLCGARRPEASPIPTTKLKQPALHWAHVVSVTAGLTSDLDWPALAAFWNAFFLLTGTAGNASSFFHDFDEAMCSGASFLLDNRRSV